MATPAEIALQVKFDQLALKLKEDSQSNAPSSKGRPARGVTASSSQPGPATSATGLKLPGASRQRVAPPLPPTAPTPTLAAAVASNPTLPPGPASETARERAIRALQLRRQLPPDDSGAAVSSEVPDAQPAVQPQAPSQPAPSAPSSAPSRKLPGSVARALQAAQPSQSTDSAPAVTASRAMHAMQPATKLVGAPLSLHWPPAASQHSSTAADASGEAAIPLAMGPPQDRQGTKRSRSRSPDAPSARLSTDQDKEESKTTLFVADLPPNIASGDLQQLFAEYGEVVEARVIGSKCYGFVTFADAQMAADVLSELTATPMVVQQSILAVSYARGEMPDWKRGLKPRVAGRAVAKQPEAHDNHRTRRDSSQAVAAAPSASGQPGNEAQPGRSVMVYDDI